MPRTAHHAPRTFLALVLTMATLAAAETKLTAPSLLFPYQVVEGSAAKSGLREDHDGQAISRAKPVIAPAGAVIDIVGEETVTYDDGTRIAVVKVKATCDGFTDRRNGQVLPFKELNGFMLAKHVR